jgi:hydrogenase nickel incorporation protein HypA/HybF
MHEVAIADALIAQVEDEVRRAGAAGKVTRLELSIGRLSGVSADALRFALELLAPGTIVESAQVDIRQPNAVCCCAACGARAEIDNVPPHCPSCDARELTIEGGRDMLLESIELEDTES